MADIFLKIVNMSISACWIVLAVLLLRVVLKKAPKWINCVLWGIAGLRLVLPYSFESVFSLIPSAETITKVSDSPRPHIDSGVAVIDNQVNGYLQGNYFEGVTRPMGHFIDISTIFAIVWIVGIAALFIYTLISFFRLKSEIGTAVLLRDNIYQSEAVVSPFVLGIIKPKIYLPFTMKEQDMNHVLAHEQAHISRKDYLWKPLGFLILTLHWFNPMVWLGYILLCRDIELACDEKVVKELNNEQRADYSEALLACSVNRRMIAACPLAFGEVGVKDRIKSVLNYKKPAFWIVVFCIVGCVIFALVFLTDPVNTSIYNSKFETGKCLYSYVVTEEKETRLNNNTFNVTTDGAVYKTFEEGTTVRIGNLVEAVYTAQALDDALAAQGAKLNLGKIANAYEVDGDEGAYVLYRRTNGSFYLVSFFSDRSIMNIYQLKKIGECELSVSEAEKANIKENTIVFLDMDGLKSEYPSFFGLPTEKGLAVYIWQMAAGSYSCALLPAREDAYTQQEVWALHTSSTDLDAMRLIVADYMTNRNVLKDDISIIAVSMPHSSYHYEIDDAYRQDLEKLFWSVTPIVANTVYSPVLDTAEFDIDGDGVVEKCTLSCGPTSGLHTVVFEAAVEGQIKYINTFNCPVFEITFEENEAGATVLIGKQNGETVIYEISVRFGNIVLTGPEGEMWYWGQQGVTE